MRVGAVRTRRAQGELDPERSLLAEPDGERAARLAVQAAVAVDFRMMLHQIARAPRPEGLLVGHRGEGELALEMLAHAMQVVVGEDRGRRARLHVGDPAPVDLAVGNGAAPRIVGPALGLPVGGDRKSTRLNSSHLVISYAVFCLKKKKNTTYILLLQKKKKTNK